MFEILILMITFIRKPETVPDKVMSSTKSLLLLTNHVVIVEYNGIIQTYNET